MINNLLKIVLASLLLTSATGTAKAVTVDDLVQYGGDAIEIFYGNYVQRSFLDRSNGIKLVKTGDNTLLLKGFYGNSCDVPFKLVNNRLVLDYDDNTLTLRHQSLREEKNENRTVILTFVVLRKD